MTHRSLTTSSCLAALLVGLIVWGGGFAFATNAQDTGAIAGQVIDRQTQTPLPDINVVVAGTLYGAATDGEGAFRIEGLPPETYTVQVSALGYRTARLSVTVEAGETAQITFRLTPTAEEAAAAVVDPDTSALQPQSTLDRRSLHEADEADLAAALRDVPGGGAVRRGALGFEPVVRGLAGPQLGVFIDGTRAFAGSPFQTGSPLSVLDPTMAERITVVKGPYALMHGGGALSAIRVETPEVSGGSRAGALQGSFRGNGSVAETAGALQGRAFGASYRVQGVYRSGRDYTDGAGTSVPASYTAGGAHGRVDVPLTGVSTLSVRGAVQDQRDVAYPGRTLDAESVRSGYGTVRYQLDRGVGLIRHMEAQAHAAQSLHDLGNGSRLAEQLIPTEGVPDPNTVTTADAERVTLGGRWSAQFAPLNGWRLTAGADGYRSNQRGTWTVIPLEPVTFPSVARGADVVQSTIGGFANATRALGPVDVSSTVRLDWMQSDADQIGSSLSYATASDVDWSGALTLSTALTPQWTASAGIGSTVRPPSARERYAERFLAVSAPEQTEASGNPRLDPERSTQADVWLQGTFERGSLQVNGFARWMDDYITLEDTPTIDPGFCPDCPELVYRYVNGSATFYGVDASGRFAVNPLLTLSGRASYTWGEDETRSAPAPNVAPLTGAVSARAEAPFNENLYLDVTTRFATAHDRVSPVFGERSTDGYAALDLRLGLALSADATVVLRAENLTDAAYAHPLNASDPFTGIPIAEPGRTLGLGLRVAF